MFVGSTNFGVTAYSVHSINVYYDHCLDEIMHKLCNTAHLLSQDDKSRIIRKLWAITNSGLNRSWVYRPDKPRRRKLIPGSAAKPHS